MDRNINGECSQVRCDLTSPTLVPQVDYIPPRQQKKFEGPKNIDFLVHGEKGIRVSDALEGKWSGLVGRDDRPLAEDDRAQITFRLLVRLRAILPP